MGARGILVRSGEVLATAYFAAVALPAFAAIRILAVAARVGRRPPRRGTPRRLLFLPHDPPGQAGARHRFAAWADRLRARGIRVDVRHPCSDREIDALWGPSRPRREAFALLVLARRIRDALASSRFDAVVYGRHALPRFPYGGPEMERLLAAVNPRTFLDVDDALWTDERPPAGPGPLGRLLHRWTRPDRSEAAMPLLAGVLAGNAYLATHARERNENVHVIPTCVDPDRVLARRHAEEPRPVVGWIGTAGNLAHLDGIAPVLVRLARETPFVLRVVSSEPWEHPGVPTDFVPWSAAGEAAAVASFDVGIMPLAPTPDAEGKCGLKLLQYMAAGVPPVATPLGVNREIVVPGVNGYSPETPEAWQAALGRLLGDAALRRRMGAAARRAARRRWSYDAVEPAFLAALSSARGGQ